MKVDIVSPVFNEEAVIEVFLAELNESVLRLRNQFGVDIRVILVDDGSTDLTFHRIARVKTEFDLSVIRLARNFGHQNAVWAGLEAVRKESFCIVIDSDLQDPPREIEKIIDAFKNKFDVVLMQRSSRNDHLIKKVTANLYYRIHSRLTNQMIIKNVGDFFGLSPRALKALLLHQESIKYIRSLVAQLGLQRIVIQYERQQRRLGYTHYTVARMFGLAVAGVTGFSVRPLLWVVYGSILGTIVGVVFILYVLILKFGQAAALTPGWSFAVVSSTLFSVMILVGLSVISIYLARIVQELKNRPVYIVDEEEE